MENQGWISLHRKIKDHWLWKQDRVFSEFEAWIYILLSVNYAPAKISVNGQLIEVNEGQLLTSIAKLSDNFKWSRKKVSRFLDGLERDQMLSQERTSKYTLLTVINWAYYQQLTIKEEHQKNIKSTTEEQQKHIRGTSEEHQKNTNNNKDNNNNVNKEDKKTYGDFFERIWSLYPVKKGKGSVSDTQKRKLYAIGYDELKRAIERYSAENANTDLKYWKHGSTFFNSGYVDYLDANYQPVQKMHQQPDCPPKYEKWERMQDYVQKQDPTVKRIPIPRPDATLQERVNYENRVEFLYDQALKTQKREEKQNGL